MTPGKLNRRGFLHLGALAAAGAMAAGQRGAARAASGDRPKVRIGLVTDLHYADREPAGTRHYRETATKLAEAMKAFEREEVDQVVALGDLIDSADTLDVEKGYLRRIVQGFAAARGKRHFVIGNHCVSALTKSEFLEIVGQRASCYAFDAGGVHFVVLDACFRSDGTPYGRKNFDWTDAHIPAAQIEWLRTDLKRTSHPAVVFVHQRLDVKPPLGIKNAPEVRKALEDSGRVRAVFQGHDHQGGHQEIAGVHYCTLQAMVEGSGPENNAYAVVEIKPDDSLRIIGFRKQKGIELRGTGAPADGKRSDGGGLRP